ncbi:uncharacterized protein ARMOST_16460 [Armillaria ostoyae]|uniref:Uncharacterized protein n=1 Tax=Armillaria ostoyae TaxID=47428 RepID=A0A284RW87_ARMOS|nr:uncharacterized protein ARMOST_16460 [Armillaria ostoyae]
MSAPQTSVATRSTEGTVAPKEALKLRLDLNLEVEIAIQAKVNGDITLSLLNCGFVNNLPEPPLQTLKTIQSSDDFVSQLLRGTRPLLDDDHALLDAEIAKLKQLRSLYDAQLEEIQSRRRSVLKGLEYRRSTYPLSVVSPGIFSSKSSISFATLGGGILKRTASQEYITIVWIYPGPFGILGSECQGGPPFSKHASEVLQTYLERTGEHPLNLRAAYYDDNGTADNKEIISLIIQSCSRWKNVYLCTHPRYLRSISHLPFLQTINLYTIDDDSDYRLDTFLNSPQLWRATILSQGTVRLLPTITHYSGYIDCEEDLHLLSHLPKLRTCYPRLRGPSVKFRFQAPVVMAELRHLYVDVADTLNVLTAPLLVSLTISESTSQGSAYINSFLCRSGCHLESLSYSMWMPMLGSVPPTLIGDMLSLEACYTISRLKLELGEEFDQVAEVLTSSSVLPNLRHLIPCLTTPAQEWYLIRDMLRSRRDVGLIKSIELQFKGDGRERWDKYDRAVAEIRELGIIWRCRSKSGTRRVKNTRLYFPTPSLNETDFMYVLRCWAASSYVVRASVYATQVFISTLRLIE